MNNGIVLNHLSLPFESKAEVSEGILTFCQVLLTCRNAGLRILRVDEYQNKSLMGLQLSKGYFVGHWYEFAKGKPELRDWLTILQTVETQQPLFEPVDLADIDHAIEVGLKGNPNGMEILLAAYYFNIFLASFTALELWTKPQICVWVHTLDSEIEESEGKIPNLCNDYSIEFHRQELKKRRNELISSAKDIWDNRFELFPHLYFLPEKFGSELQTWSAPMEILNKARDSLNVLETFCTKWQAGEYEGYRHQHLKILGLAA